MAGLESQNISVASGKLSGTSISDKDVCVFCHRRATPLASDPHAPLFPFFSLVDCRHYACQPCALVHCDNAGRCIACPQCNCVSRLAQSGRRRNRSSAEDAAAGGGRGHASRVLIDDGVSSVRSHRSATARVSPHRSALKGQSGFSNKRSSSVQFPANPTTSIVDAENASLASSHRGDGGADGLDGDGRRATSPLTQDAVAALPVDPSEARRQRVREQQQRRADAAAAKAEKSVSLYAITAAPPKAVTSTMSGNAAPLPTRRSKERSHSQPVPKLPNTILEPKQVFPVPPPLVLHTIDEDEPAATADAAEQDNATSPASVSLSKPSVNAMSSDDNIEGTTQPSEESKPPSPSNRAHLDSCEAAESEARDIVIAAEALARTKLYQSMEEAETTIHARRGLEDEFESTPRASQPEHALAEFSDQVSATSDDELSQRSSARKMGGGSSSSAGRRKHRTPRGSVVEGEAAPLAGGDAQKGHLSTPAAVSSVGKSMAGTVSTVDTPSPMTAARPAKQGEVADEPLVSADVEAATADLEKEDADAKAKAKELRVQEQLAQEALEAQTLFAEQQQRLSLLESRARAQLEGDAADEGELIGQQQQREMQQQRRARELREADAVEESQLRQRQQQERMAQLEERHAFARRSLEDRESLERDALGDTEAAVRAHYVFTAEEWRKALIPHAMEAQHRARTTAEAAFQQQMVAAAQKDEMDSRNTVASEEADEWAWLISGARVDRVLAATDESERVQREYDELRCERLIQQFHQDAVELVAEEQRRRCGFEEYEATTRSVLQSHCAVQGNAAAEEEERLRREAAQKAVVRREAALQQRWQREREELDIDEVEGRAIVREEEREDRRTASMIFVQGMAAVRRRELLASLANSARRQEEEDAAAAAAAAEAAEHALLAARAAKRKTGPGEASAYSEDPSAGDAATAAASLLTAYDEKATPPPPSAYQQLQQQAEASRISAEQLEELRARQTLYEQDMLTAMQRLQEAERRVAEEAATRARVEEERRASQVEAERLLREAEQRAEQRIRDARDAAERLMQAQLADVRDEAARRAEHAAVMQSLAEEEQRAVLEAKLQAAERQLQQAQQRAEDEIHRAREEAAALAAAETARAAQEAQRREDEWQERARAEKLLRLAEQESEKEDAIRRLSDLEARAAEAVRLAREEAAHNAAVMEERIAEMERRQQAREAEVQQASQRVRNARDSMRDFDSRSQSSMHTTPSRAEMLHDSPQQQQQQQMSSSHAVSLRSSRRASVSVATTPSRSDVALAASAPAGAHHSGSPMSRTSARTPPLALPLSPSSCIAPGVASAAMENSSTPPRVLLGVAAASPSPSAQAAVRSRQQTPLSPAALVRAGSGRVDSAAYAFDPAEVVRAAIREAVTEIIAAQQRAQSLKDQAEQHVELSERRFQRRRSDRALAAHDVAVLETSHAQSEAGESPHDGERQPSSQMRASFDQAHASPMAGQTPSLGSAGAHSEYSGQQERDESPLVRSAASTPGPGVVLVPVPSATAAVPGSAMSNTVSHTSSVYFDDQPYSWSANPGHYSATLAQGQHRYESLAPRAQQQQQQQPQEVPMPANAQVHSAASRVLFPNQRTHTEIAAGAGVHAAQNQRHGAHGRAAPPLSKVEGHAYNEPEPSQPAPVTAERSPPPRRSTTRADTDNEQPRPTERAAMAPYARTPVLPVPVSTGILPQPSRVCPRCYRDDTTSPCWRCGEMVCRQCGLRPGSERKLCCSAHLRDELREHARRRVNSPAVMAPGPRGSTYEYASQQQQQQQHQTLQQRRGDQQVQTSFASSSDVSYNGDAGDHRATQEEAYFDAPERHDAGTSTRVAQEPVSMIPPSAYYQPPPQRQPPPPQQQQQQAYYFDGPGVHANPVSIAAMTAPGPAAYPSGNPHMPYAYPQPYPPQWLWHPQAQPVGVADVAGVVRSPQPQMYPAPQPQSQQVTSRVQTPPPLPASMVRPQDIVEVAEEQDEAQETQMPTPPSKQSVSPSAKPATPHRQNARETAGSAAQRAAQQPSIAPSATASRGEHNSTHGAVDVPVSVGAESQLSTPDASPTASREPKTERKKAAAAFFVALDGGAEEPRRPKPPTPCNYVPIHAFEPHAVRAAAKAAKQHANNITKKPAPSPRAAHTRSESTGAKVEAGQRRASPSLRTQAVRPALHDPYAARERNPHSQQRQQRGGDGAPQRRTSPSPYGASRPQKTSASPHTQPRPSVRNDAAAMQPVIASYMKAVAPMHPRFAEVRKDGHAVYVMKQPAPAPEQRQQQQQQQQQVLQRQPYRSASSDSYSSYTTSTSSTSQHEVDQRARQTEQRRSDEGNAYRYEAPMGQRIAPVAGETRHTPQPSQNDIPRTYDGVDARGYLPPRAHLQSSSGQAVRRVGPSYESYSSLSTATADTQQQQQDSHRYGPRWSAPSTASFSAADRRVPTLAELDRRLQELRAQDEAEAAHYQQRQSRLGRTVSPPLQQQQHPYVHPSAQPQVHVLLQAPGCTPRAADSAAVGGPRYKQQQQQQQRHRSRSPRLRTVSPPWRTDLNSSPLRPHWDISQPRSPLYHPPAATAGR